MIAFFLRRLCFEVCEVTRLDSSGHLLKIHLLESAVERTAKQFKLNPSLWGGRYRNSTWVLLIKGTPGSSAAW